MPLLVTTSSQAAERDARAPLPSARLMANAGAMAADALLRHAADRLQAGVAVYAGTGNNGGDAWVVAAYLRANGVRTTVFSAGDPRTDDARAARDEALRAGPFDSVRGDEACAVDGLLGTGVAGEPRGTVLHGLEQLAAMRARGAFVLALDVPSGLDATTGTAARGTVGADVTVTFGTLKRGLTISRAMAGAIEVVDIGLGAAVDHDDGTPALLDARAVRASIPPIGASAHKGTRGQIAIVGGSAGMAGAVVFASRGALRAGAGLVRAVVAPDSVSAVQAAVPEATASAWPLAFADVSGAVGHAQAIVIGPGLGRANAALLDVILANTLIPAVLDADALNAFAGNIGALSSALRGRPAVLTPHPAECARLLGTTTDDVLANRFDIGLTVARAANAIVVLKGTPTVVSAPDGRVTVAPVGSPVLATGGSGDILAGVAGALLAVVPDAYSAALAAVWAHGAAAERVGTTRVRGATLDDVVLELKHVWHADEPSLPPGVLAVLPRVGES